MEARRKTSSITEQLEADASRFTFLQAVRLMEEMHSYVRYHGDGPAVGEAVHEKEEMLFFRHRVGLDDPASDVDSLRCEPGERPVMTVNVMGLAGVLGPLPYSVTETIFARRSYHDTALPDFLDIFNHRLISLLYSERKKFRPALDRRAPHDGPVARVLSALLGLGTPQLRGRVLAVQQDRGLFAYAGFFAQRYRSAPGLERILADYFGVAAKVRQFIGEWDKIELDDRTAIGAKLGRNQSLGVTTIVGARFWDQAARFEVRVGPLTLDRFRSFIPPANDAFRPLVSLIRFFTREELGIDIRLLLAAGAMPQLRIGRESGAYLGYTTWLRGRPEPPATVDEQLRLVGCR